MLGTNHATRKEVVVLITGISLVSSPCCGVLTSLDISVDVPNLWLHLLVSDNVCNGPFACIGGESQSNDASISVGFQSCNSEFSCSNNGQGYALIISQSCNGDHAW